MKRIFAVLMILVLSLSLFACGDKDIKNAEPGFYENNEKFQIGEIKGDTYENKFFGIKCEIDNGWTFSTKEEIAELNNFTMDYLPEDLVEYYENSTNFIDMYASSEQSFDNINISAHKLSKSEIESFDAKKNFEQAIPSLEETFENMGYTDCEFDIIKTTVDGVEYDAYRCTAQLETLSLYQEQIAVIRNGYLVTITVTTYDVDTCSDVFGFLTIEK